MSNVLPVPKGTIYQTDEEKVRLESRNGAIQAAFVLHTANEWKKGTPVTPDILLELQRLAVNQIYRCAGHFRDGKVVVGTLVPPDYSLVPGHVADMCGYINAHWQDRSAVHLSAYAMWRLNWIHPFYGGNGRTARAFSYLVLCIALGFALPALDKTIPELIVDRRKAYLEALRKADAVEMKTGNIDLTEMENLLSSLLAAQLVSLHNLATGNPPA
jgi:Fic family protein